MGEEAISIEESKFLLKEVAANMQLDAAPSPALNGPQQPPGVAFPGFFLLFFLFLYFFCIVLVVVMVFSFIIIFFSPLIFFLLGIKENPTVDSTVSAFPGLFFSFSS